MKDKPRVVNCQLEQAIQHHREGRLDQAERLCRQVCAADPDDAGAFHLLGIVAHQLGRADAVTILEQAVVKGPNRSEIYNDLGVVLGAKGMYAEASVSFERAIALTPNFIQAHDNLGVALSNLGKHLDGARCFERALSINPGFALAELHLGNSLAARGLYDDAISHYHNALSANPNWVIVHYSLAAALKRKGKTSEAIAHLERALTLAPDFADAHDALGRALQFLGRPEEAAAHLQQAITLRPNFAGTYNNLANVLVELGSLEQAALHYDRAISLDPEFCAAFYNRGVLLRRQSRFEEAAECFRRALELDPSFAEAKLALCVAQLPMLYTTEQEISARRAAYRACLEELRCGLERVPITRDLTDLIGAHQPFYLAYQGMDDRALQAIYGSIACQIIAAHRPPLHFPSSPTSAEPVKVGIVSGFFRKHSNWKIPIIGWLGQLDRNRFRIFGYHTGHERDFCTETAAALCHRFVQGPLSADQWRRAIRDDEPHILIYPEVGMDPMSARLAAQRLAPVQCASWGHPETTGLPSIDFFLSSKMMEPENGDDHYVERLIRLPNLSIYYDPPDITPIVSDRAELGLGAKDVAFWCGQSLPKYLPQHDDVFPRIAREAGNCQFAFVRFPGAEHVTDVFRKRLQRSFSAVGLCSSDYCVFLPRLEEAKFIAAMGACDAFLDSIGWSGCNSTLESLTHNLPIVTVRGALMRARHTTAILQLIGMPELIAETVDEYVAIAVRLAKDGAYRNSVSARIAELKHRAYRDSSCIKGLEEFLDRQARTIPAD